MHQADASSGAAAGNIPGSIYINAISNLFLDLGFIDSCECGKIYHPIWARGIEQLFHLAKISYIADLAVYTRIMTG